MERPEHSVWRDLSDDEYAEMQTSSWALKTCSEELTAGEHADFSARYPRQYAAAMAVKALAADTPYADLKPAAVAALKACAPEIYEQARDLHEQATAPLRDRPWAFKLWSELRPVERAAFKAAEPEAYEKARAAALGERA